MSHDANDLADMVILTVKAALAPVLERLAAAEARLGVLPVTEKSLSDVRDRLVIVETKAAAPVDVPTVDLSPVLERLAVAESRIAQLPEAEKAIGEMRDRLLVFETKATVPPVVTAPEPVDLAPVLERVAELHEALQAKAAPVVDLGPLTERVSRLESKSVEASPVIATVTDLTKDVAGIRERLAVVETRQPVPGPAGPAGQDGKDGRDGKDGADGLGFDDLSAEFDGDRTLAVKFERGSRVKTFPIRLPYMRHQGVYIEGKSYDIGDVVTWGGSQWHCQSATTAKPGEGSKDWVLVVKRGRDGKDGKDAATVPVVSVGVR